MSNKKDHGIINDSNNKAKAILYMLGFNTYGLNSFTPARKATKPPFNRVAIKRKRKLFKIARKQARGAN